MTDLLEPSERDSPDISPPDEVYAYKPSLLGAPYEFTLSDTALHWRVGSHAGSVPYDRIARVRLSFRPLTMQSYRFLAEIWPDAGPKLQISSTSWRSMIEQESKGPAYSRFLIDLHRRMTRAGTHALLQTGSSPLLYWPGLVVFVVVTVGLAFLTVHALQSGQLTAAALVGGFFALFLWQVGAFFRRNRPMTYRPDAIPDALLPRR
jgi:hypothetical protein